MGNGHGLPDALSHLWEINTFINDKMDPEVGVVIFTNTAEIAFLFCDFVAFVVFLPSIGEGGHI